MPASCDTGISIADYLQVITCNTAHEGRIVRKIIPKGYCSTKKMYCYGLKLHALIFRNRGTVPLPESIAVTAAEENVPRLFRQL
jgi:hypothetical protein